MAPIGALPVCTPTGGLLADRVGRESASMMFDTTQRTGKHDYTLVGFPGVLAGLLGRSMDDPLIQAFSPVP